MAPLEVLNDALLVDGLGLRGMIRVHIEPALGTYQLLVLDAETMHKQVRVLLAVYQYLPSLLGHLVSDILIDLQGHWLVEPLGCAVVAAAEQAFELALLHDILIICLNHVLLHAVLARRGAAAIQNNRLPLQQVEALFAYCASQF